MSFLILTKKINQIGIYDKKSYIDIFRHDFCKRGKYNNGNNEEFPFEDIYSPSVKKQKDLIAPPKYENVRSDRL